MKPNKTLAAGVAAALMAGSLTAITAVGLASSANAAGPSTAPLYCDVSGISSSVANWATTWSVNVNGSPAAASVAAGATVSTDLTYANGPNNGGPAVVGRAKAVIEVVQGATVVQTLTTPWTADVAVPGGTAVPPGQFPGATLASSFTAPVAGAYNVQVKNVVFEGYLGGGSSTGFLAATVNCNNNDTLAGPTYSANNPTNNQIAFGATALTTTAPVTLPSATISTSTAQAPGAQYIARNGYARTVALTGSNFDVSDSTGDVQFCNAAGSACDTTAGTTDSLETDASGALTGSIVIASTDTLTPGARSIKISGLSASDVLVPVHVLSDPVIVLGAATNTAGTSVTVTGSEFNTGGQPTSVYGSTSGVYGPGLATATTDTPVSITASATGTFSTTFTANDLATASIVGTQGTPGPPSADRATGFSPYTVTAAPVDTTAPTGSAALAATKGLTGSSATVNLTGVTDNVSAANAIVPTVTWAPGVTEVLAAGATTATHVYPASGDYAVSVTLKDAANNESATIPAGTYQVRSLNGSFTRSSSSLYATKSLRLTPSGVTADVNSMVISWGDGKTTTTSNKTAAVNHVYTAAGTRTIKVTLRNTATGLSVLKTVGSVKVVKDVYKPTVSLTTPKKATKGSSWKTLRGKAGDRGLGVSAVGVSLVLKSKANGKWYYYNGKKWVKTTSRKKAENKAAVLVDRSIVKGAWSVSIKKKPAKGKLYVGYLALDRAGNSSSFKVKSQTIKS